ncbi:MAG TPA: hypothetical protein VFC51_14445 [Chloroflexota bacterium]|nr:hypothetical protein [Chloroflexota bacterium]
MADRFAETGLFLFTAAGWGLLLYVIFFLPVSSTTQAIFYASGFVALAGSVAFVGAQYQSRARHAGEGRPRAVAQLGWGMRLAFVIEFALWLQSLRVLTAAYFIFIVAGFLFLEILFRYATGDRRGSRE